MKNINPFAIELKNISKHYLIHHEKPTLIEQVINGKTEKFKALDDISLKVKRGEIVGIIGPNGSGKTTLLKIIAGITAPTTGIVSTNGRVVSLIDLEAGFHPDLTGLQNIYLSGMLLGMNKKNISRKLSKIVSFADIGHFVDAQLFTYSQGMKLRLGFSIVAFSNPKILILDENFSVGDAAFQKKSIQKIREFYQKGTTIVVVSHWLEFIKKICKRIIIMKRGKIIHDGDRRSITKYLTTDFGAI